MFKNFTKHAEVNNMIKTTVNLKLKAYSVVDVNRMHFKEKQTETQRYIDYTG